jgi:hypothetical protein
MVLTIGDDVGVLFMWSVCTSKYGNSCKYSQKIKKKREKIHCYVLLLKKLEECLHGLCAFTNMESNANIARILKKKRKHWFSLLLMMLEYCLHGLCTFPNMVINENLSRKSEEKRRKNSLM